MRWDERRDNLLRRHFPKGDLSALAERIGVTKNAVKSRARVLGIRRKVNVKRPWTDRQVAYLREHYADTPIDVLILKTRHDQKGIWNKAKALGLRKSREFLQAIGLHHAQHPRSVATRFVKGQRPTNKGMRQEEFMSADSIERSKATRFKKGNIPHNAKPVGYERVDKKSGYVFVKVSGRRKMVQKHRHVWEQHHGPVPDGHYISFRDGDRQNCDIANLVLLSKEEHGRKRIASETPEQRRLRMSKALDTRNKTIRRDRIRIHFGLEPKTKLVKRW